MIQALTYQEMLHKISDKAREDGIIDGYVGILITRPDLETGKNILKSLEYYHYLTRGNITFYLPGYGAYWYGAYPDGKVVTEIDGVQWSFSNKEFVQFIREMESYSKWKYCGESELLLLHTKDGILSYEVMMQFRLDNMLRDEVIDSIPSYFQELFRLFENKDSLEQISDALGMDKFVEMAREGVLDKLPGSLGKLIKHEKYLCVKNMKKD